MTEEKQRKIEQSEAPWPRWLILTFGELARRDEGSNPGEGTKIEQK